MTTRDAIMEARALEQRAQEAWRSGRKWQAVEMAARAWKLWRRLGRMG